MNREPGTNRLEAFSDGVFAIAITLLILEVKAPDGAGSLAHRLGEAWPSYASFLISFAVIGTMWLNHDRMFQLIHRSDHGVVLANLFLLLVISAIPFPTKVVGDELNRGTFADQRTATILYGVTFVAASIAFPLLWHAACRGGGRLLAPDLPDRERLIQTRRNLLGFPIFASATVVALWSPAASLAVFGALTIAYLMPSGPLDRLLVRGREG